LGKKKTGILQTRWSYPLGLTSIKQVKYWYNNRARREVAPPRFKAPRKVSLIQVLSRDYKEEIARIASGLADGAPGGSRAHFGNWMRAAGIFKGKMSAAELEAAEEAWKQWEEKGVPDEVKRIHATKYGRRCLEEAAVAQFKAFGSRALTWQFYFNAEGNTLFSMSVRLFIFFGRG